MGIAVFICQPGYSQVSLATAPTVTFSNATGFADNIASDGDGGSVTITDFNLEATPIDNTGATLTADPLQYHDSNDWPGYPPIITYGDTNPLYAWSIRSASGSDFSLLSIDFNDWGFVSGDPFKIEAYQGGALTGTLTFASNIDISVNITLSQTSTDPDFLLPPAFGNVDEVRILMEDESGSLTGINNIQVAPANFVLPLTLLSFNASIEDNAVQLQWETAAEMNVSHFEIERSADGRSYNSLGRVSSNANGGGRYSYLDNAAPSTQYYRLKMVDLDLSFTYSHVLLVRNSAGTDLRVYPNPANSSVQLSIPRLDAGNSYIRILNLQGVQLSTRNLNIQGQASTISMDVNTLRPGRYFIEIIAGSEVRYRSGFIKL